MQPHQGCTKVAAQSLAKEICWLVSIEPEYSSVWAGAQHDIEHLNGIVDYLCQHTTSRPESGTLDPKVQASSPKHLISTCKPNAK